MGKTFKPQRVGPECIKMCIMSCRAGIDHLVDDLSKIKALQSRLETIAQVLESVLLDTEEHLEDNLHKYKLHWLHGKTEVVEGKSIADAFSRAGYGQGALRALDYFKEVS